MAKREKKYKKSGIGKLFLGIFLGFILSLGAIVGVGFFAYKNLSIVWLNKTFNTKLDLGTDDANNRTIEDFAKSFGNILQMNTKAYTFNQLKNDFGIDILKMLSDSVGLDLSSMGNQPITDIAGGLKKVISDLNAEELGKFIDVSALNDVILDKEITYFVHNNELYKSRTYSTKVSREDLDYKIADNKVYLNGDTENGTEINKDTSVVLNGTTYYVHNEELYSTLTYSKLVDKEKDFNYQIGTSDITIEGVVNAHPVDFATKTVLIQVKNMNLVSAMNEYLNKIGDVTTINELETEFGVKLPDFVTKHIDKNKFINELGDEIDKIKLVNFLDNYTIDETDPLNIIIKNDKGEEVTGILYDIAVERVGNISDLLKKFDSVAAKDLTSVMEFSEDTNKLLDEEIYYFVDVSNPDEPKLYKDEAKTKAVDFAYKFNEDATKVEIGDTEFDVTDSKISTALKNIPLQSAITDYMYAMETQKTFGELADKFNFQIPEKLEELTNKKLNEINDDVFNDIELGGFLGYLKDETDATDTFYYKDHNGNEVYDEGVDEKATGLMKTLTEKTLIELEDLSSIIYNATATDLESIMEFDKGTKKILNKTNTYYFNPLDEKLYKVHDSGSYTYSEPVITNPDDENFEFEYDVSADKNGIIVNDQKIIIENGNEVKIPLKHLPLSYGLSTFTSNMGTQLTFKELSEDFGVELPNYLKNRTETINQLGNVVNQMKLGEILGYVENEGKFYKDNDNSGTYTTGDTEISSLNAKFAVKTVDELKDLKSIVDSLVVRDIYSDTSTGILSLIDSNTTVAEIPNAIKTAINTNNLYTLVDKGVVSTNVILNQKLTVSGYTDETIGDLTFADIFIILDAVSN